MGGYRWYVLGLFTIIYAFNFIDRQIITIVAPYLKADLGLTDAQLGLLYGTAFALFYALFGLPLAKLVDGWNRVRTLSIGLILWSAMTTLSGYARNFSTLGGARIGVGVGEASASPAAFSVLQDYFPKTQRATALAIYSSGIFIGSGASLMVGGWVIAAWERAYPHGVTGPLGLTAGWQAAFLAVGIPGILLGILTWATVREPVRGAIDGTPQPPADAPFRAALAELATLFAPFSWWRLHRLGASGPTIAKNMLMLGGCLLGAWAITQGTNGLLGDRLKAPALTMGATPISTNAIQWAAMGIALYAILTWGLATRLADPEAYRRLITAPTFLAITIAGGLISFMSYGVGAFFFVYAKGELNLTATDGLTLGAIQAIGGGIGTVLGGACADRWRRHTPAGGIYVAMIAVPLSCIFGAIMLTTASQTVFYTANFCQILSLTMWLGPLFATGQDHAPPRLRGMATAAQFFGINLIGLGLGPYTVGLISDVSGDLRFALLSTLVMLIPVLALLGFAARRFPAYHARIGSQNGTTPQVDPTSLEIVDHS